MEFLFALWLSITENQDIGHVKIRRKKFAWMGKFHYNSSVKLVLYNRSHILGALKRMDLYATYL